MKISNFLHFTENHHYYTYRDFSISPLDYTMLHRVYQPMVGTEAVGLYLSMSQEIPAEQIGYSKPEMILNLFMAAGMKPGEKGRRRLANLTSLLESVGLMQSGRRAADGSEDFVYAYHLLPPLNPGEFFKTQHLVMLLRDKIGKYAVLRLQELFFRHQAEDLFGAYEEAEDLTMPFYEMFEINLNEIDNELEQALVEMAPSEVHPTAKPGPNSRKYEYADLISRFPRDARNRRYVERLQANPEQLDSVNYIAAKYFLTLQETVRLLDEDGVFGGSGNLDADVMEEQAILNFRQNRKREAERDLVLNRMSKRSDPSTGEVPEGGELAVNPAYYLEVPEQFKGQCDAHQYNLILRNEPYTHVLQRFHPGAVPKSSQDLFERIDVHYKLNEEVINVLLHHIFTRSDNGPETPLNHAYIDKVVSSMLAKQVRTYEEAVVYFRKIKEKSIAKPSGWQHAAKTKRGRQKPQIAMASGSRGESAGMSPEALERILKKAEKLDGNRKQEP